jgi:hypothetical protein
MYACVYEPALEATALTCVHGLAMGLVITVRQAVWTCNDVREDVI